MDNPGVENGREGLNDSHNGGSFGGEWDGH